MALPSVGGGYQFGDGNLSEVRLDFAPPPQTATATATLTVAQALGGVLVANPSTTAATYTLPNAVDIDAALGNAKVGSTFDLNVINIGTSTGTVTLAAGTGLTDGGNALVVIPVTSSAAFLFRKTGAGSWTVYKTA